MNTKRLFSNSVTHVLLISAACFVFLGADVCDTNNCVSGFVDSKALLGGIECDHGPEYDDDCFICYTIRVDPETGQVIFEDFGNSNCCETSTPGANCIYLVNGNPQQGTIKGCDGQGGTMPLCKDKCYNCTLPENPNCETRALIWKAHCGIFDNPPSGDCETHYPEDPPEGPPISEVIRIDIPQKLNAVASCSGDPGSTNNSKIKYFCGGGNITYADCVSLNACVDDPDKEPVEHDGKRRRCGPKPT